MNETICQAIDERRVLEFDYTNESGAEHHRIVNPYVHGVTISGGEGIRAYQVGGTSSSSRVLGWRLFYVDRMTDIRIRDEVFVPDDPDYATRDPDMAEIHCRVQPWPRDDNESSGLWPGITDHPPV